MSQGVSAYPSASGSARATATTISVFVAPGSSSGCWVLDARVQGREPLVEFLHLYYWGGETGSHTDKTRTQRGSCERHSREGGNPERLSLEFTTNFVLPCEPLR